MDGDDTKWLEHFTERIFPRYCQVKDDEIFHVLAGHEHGNHIFYLPVQCRWKNRRNHEQMINLSEFKQVFGKSLVILP